MGNVVPFLAPLVVVLLAGTAKAADGGYAGMEVRADPDGKGIFIVEVAQDGPADKAGLKANDVITTKDGKAVGELQDFVKSIRGHKPGDKVTLTILRDGKEKEIKLTIGKQPAGNG